MAGKRRTRNTKYRRKTRNRRMNAQERQMQLIRRGVVMVLALCVVLLGVMIIQGKRGGEVSDVAQPQGETEGKTKEKAEDLEATPTQEATATPTAEPMADVSIKISAIGDCTLGSDKDFEKSTSFDTMYANVGGPSYFFRKVKDVLAEDDLTIANVEGPLTTSEDEQEKEFAFRGKPEYAEILKEGSVEAANLANNHSYDYGEQGFSDTVTNLEAAGISTFGYDTAIVKEVKGVKVGLVGIYVLKDEMGRVPQLKEKIAEVKEAGAQVVVVSFHWGAEKANYPNRVQQDLGHMAVDEGADLVIGHHPHVLQGIEKYKGKNIVYSLGNFCFGGNSNPSDKDTMIFQQTFTIQNGTVVADDNTNIIPCSISSENWYNNYQPAVLEGSEKVRVENRIKEYSEGIGTSNE